MHAGVREKLLLGALYISIAGAILVTAILVVPQKSTPTSEVIIGDEKVMVTIADTPALQDRGLGGVKALLQNEGMLFVFPKPDLYTFWMKDMLIPIDIIWFDTNRHIVDVWENAKPSSYPEARPPRAEAQYVLEVQAGFFARHALKRGDVLELKSSTRYTK